MYTHLILTFERIKTDFVANQDTWMVQVFKRDTKRKPRPAEVEDDYLEIASPGLVVHTDDTTLHLDGDSYEKPLHLVSGGLWKIYKTYDQPFKI